jgi:hypothetical protein
MIKKIIWWGNTFGYGELLKKPFLILASPFIIRFKTKEIFKYKNKKYSLFYHKYNFTWTKERGVEIPIIKESIKNFIESNKQGRILEVGNVLSHYFVTHWDIVDKFEQGENVINEDIEKFLPDKKYDLIVSISTFEHIGWDNDKIPEPSIKILNAFNNLRDNCLNKGGKIIITTPMGWNPHMDKIIEKNLCNFNNLGFLKKVGKNKWIEVDKQTALNSKYGSPFPYANCVFVGEYTKK